MKPMTQGNLPRSFKAIHLARDQSSKEDDMDRRRQTPLKNQSPMGQLYFYAKSHVHMLSQNDPYDTRKTPKKFRGDLSRSPGHRPRGSPSLKNQ
ncbi:uncharacterized protein G2W53_027125 [Senna tora]|uniref:Uncharacterized protein n=1 Tax=Senna tora TaxID=362788 RepID=A0A834TH09_9FABA|nr:uncharacterized protein G2W53_027125 [Senna tora]